MVRCGWCDVTLPLRARSDARFCSGRCRVASHRAVAPAELHDRARWVRRDAAKRPLRADTGRLASSTNPRTWASYRAARVAPFGVGLGFVVGDGVGCIDLDHCLINGEPTEAAAAFLAGLPATYVEISPSGDGLHVWGLMDEARGSRRAVDGLQVERYSRGRYITVTGRRFGRAPMALARL